MGVILISTCWFHSCSIRACLGKSLSLRVNKEDDVAVSLKRLGKMRGSKFKALLNLVIREGIKSMTGPVRKRKTFQTRSVDRGPCRTANVGNVTEVLAIAEGESFR
jgi:hypothetical protein